MRPSRRVLAASLLLIVLVQVVGRDVLAATEVCESHGLRYNCITEEVQVQSFTPLYDNGMEGTQDITQTKLPYQTWPQNWTTTGAPMRDGVKLGPLHEMRIRLIAAFNGTAQPNQTDLPYYTATDSVRVQGTPSVRALSYVVRFNATTIMSGSSEWYYRSPIIWYEDEYDKHYIMVKDPTGRLVASARYDEAAQQDNVTNALLHEGRIYYHFIARLDSLVNYTITEYVHPRDNAGLDHLDVYLADRQDVDTNGRMEYSLFPGELAQRNYDSDGDLAFSFRFVFGQGPGGTMNLLQPTPVMNESIVVIETGAFPTRNSSSVNDRYRLVIPLRTTFALNGSVVLTICPDYATYLQHRNTQGCGPNAYSARKDFVNVTGTLIEDFGDQSTVVSPPVPTSDQHYAKISLLIDNFQSLVLDGAEQNLVSYPMYTTALPDGTVSNHVISHYSANDNAVPFVRQPVEWTMWAEVIEDYVPSLPAILPPQGSSTDIHGLFDPEEWMKLGLTAFILAIVFPQISIPLYIIGVGAYLLAGTILVADLLSDPQVRADLARIAGQVANFAAGLALGAVCLGAMLAPAVGAAAGGLITKSPKGVIVGGRIGSALQPLAGAGCVALGLTEAGLMDDLLKFIVSIPHVLQRAVELTGQLLTSAIRIFVTAYDALLPWVLLFLYAMGMLLTVWLTRETALLVFAWLILLFMAMKSQPAVDVLRRGETFARMIPIPLWDNRMRKLGALRGTYYRDEIYRTGKGA